VLLLVLEELSGEMLDALSVGLLLSVLELLTGGTLLFVAPVAGSTKASRPAIGNKNIISKLNLVFLLSFG